MTQGFPEDFFCLLFLVPVTNSQSLFSSLLSFPLSLPLTTTFAINNRNDFSPFTYCIQTLHRLAFRPGQTDRRRLIERQRRVSAQDQLCLQVRAHTNTHSLFLFVFSIIILIVSSEANGLYKCIECTPIVVCLLLTHFSITIISLSRFSVHLVIRSHSLTQHTHTFILFFHFSQHTNNNPVNHQATTPTFIESTISQEPMSLNSVLGMMMPQRSVSALGLVIVFSLFSFSLYL